MNAASPTSATKGPKNSKAKQLVQVASTSSPAASVPTSPAPAPASNTPSILNFISKKSIKKVECLIQPLHGSPAPVPVQPVPSNVDNNAKSVPESIGGTPSTLTPKPMTPGLRLESDSKSRTPIPAGAMASPKMTPTSVGNLNTSCSTAEKRGSSAVPTGTSNHLSPGSNSLPPFFSQVPKQQQQ